MLGNLVADTKDAHSHGRLGGDASMEYLPPGSSTSAIRKLTPDGVGDGPKCEIWKRLAMSCRSLRLGALVQCIASNEWLDHCSSPSSDSVLSISPDLRYMQPRRLFSAGKV
ncbi:hypothetical protein HBI84_008980 [Parastagonospora nodorum]|nr:hypothetical protein HBI84_008980 [Parastagonospora nodorum]